MKLLIITNNPERASFRQRIGVYIDTLRSNGIEVVIAVLPKGMFARWRLFRSSQDFDAVLLHKKCLNIIDAFWLRKYARKIIFNYDDAIMYSDKRPDKYSRSHMVPFRRTVKLADMVLVGSANLASYSKGLNSNIEILPLGLDCADYVDARQIPRDDKVRLVWIGSSSTKCYLNIIKDLLEEIGKRHDNVIFRMICDDFVDFDHIAVEKCKWTKQTRAKDLAECDIGLAPLPDNRFTQGKCSFKVLEYSCSGLPVVASPVGTNSVHVVDGDTGFIARDTNQWLKRVSQLVDDKQLRNKMGQAGIDHAHNFDISVMGERFVVAIRNALDS